MNFKIKNQISNEIPMFVFQLLIFLKFNKF
jgi:hypothetical protein